MNTRTTKAGKTMYVTSHNGESVESLHKDLIELVDQGKTADLTFTKMTSGKVFVGRKDFNNSAKQAGVPETPAPASVDNGVKGPTRAEASTRVLVLAESFRVGWEELTKLAAEIKNG